MSKDSYYFSHDSNARNDVKLIKLRRVFAMEGIGIFWCICEMLRESENYSLPIEAIPDIAFELRVAEEKIKSIISDFNLFVINTENFFFSKSLNNRMQALENKRQQQIAAGKRGAQKRWQNSDPIGDPISDPNGECIASKVKESKVKESKVNITREHLNISNQYLILMTDEQKRQRADIFLKTHTQDGSFIELLQRQTKLNPDIIKNKVKQFTTELLVKDRIEMSIKQYRDYFGNWIKKNI